MTAPVVVLVGPPGAGKSAVGRAAAAARGVGFRDTDDDVARVAGKSIPDMFVDDGEAAFRGAERTAVADALQTHLGVLALGGGAVLDPGTRDLLLAHRVVFLDVSLAAAVPRVGLARDRPLLLGSPRAQLKQLMDQRRPLYEQVSSAHVDTSELGVDEVVTRVLAVIDEPAGARGGP